MPVAAISILCPRSTLISVRRYDSFPRMMYTVSAPSVVAVSALAIRCTSGSTHFGGDGDGETISVARAVAAGA